MGSENAAQTQRQFSEKRPLEEFLLHRIVCTRHLLPNQLFRLVVLTPTAIKIQLLADWDLGQTDVLHDCPDNSQATGFRRESVNLIGALSYIAKKALNGIGGTNIAMHHLRKRIKREQMLFVLT